MQVKVNKNKQRKATYLDYVSATPIDPRVKAHYIKLLSLDANPYSVYEKGVKAFGIIKDAKKTIAGVLSCSAGEVVCTSGGTEANNLAVIGLWRGIKDVLQKKSTQLHVVTSTVEHKSVLEPIAFLEREGVLVTRLRPEKDGTISPEKLKEALTDKTFLVSLMYANNEVGSINNIRELAKVVRQHRKKKTSSVHEPAWPVGKLSTKNFPYFHTDACQSVSTLPLEVPSLGVDLLTLNSAKTYAPSGVGVLFVKKNTPLAPIMFGGGQEAGLRSGRENPALISAFAYGLSICAKERVKEHERLSKLKTYFILKIKKIFPNVSINAGEGGLSYVVSICIKGLDAELAVFQMDHEGFQISQASTCMNTSTYSYSYVVKEISENASCETESLRFSFGRWTVKKDIDNCLKALKKIQLLQGI